MKFALAQSIVTNPNPSNSLNEFLKLGLNVAHLILGVVGALTLLMFVYGGLVWVLSGGSADRVKKGKDIIVGSVIGLVIVFSSYLIVQFVSVNILGGKFNATLPPETIISTTTQEKPGKLCATLPGPGHCETTATACGDGESSDQSDCSTGSKCCYKPSHGACVDTYHGQCTTQAHCSFGGVLGGGDPVCAYPDVCCDPGHITP